MENIKKVALPLLIVSFTLFLSSFQSLAKKNNNDFLKPEPLFTKGTVNVLIVDSTKLHPPYVLYYGKKLKSKSAKNFKEKKFIIKKPKKDIIIIE